MSYLDTYNRDDLQELKELITPKSRHTNVLNKKLKMMDLSMLGEGADRAVVHNENHDCVLKFQKKEREKTEQNKVEAKTYNRLKKKPVSNILVPVIEHTENFDIVVQQKVDQSNIDRRDVLKHSAELIYHYGYSNKDIRKENIGIYKNDGVDTLAAADYGSGVKLIKNSEFKNKDEAFEAVIEEIYIKI
jgi:hypothetical protein